jgi:hypothetical protein
MRNRRLHSSVGARPKGSNGGVAVGLPHRNSSVFKQAHINQWEVKVVRVRKADPPSAVGGLRVINKRVGSWGKKENKKAWGEHRRIYMRRSIKQVKGWK